ncbi:hypothetical protein C804_05056 [Lachnospiraceae bacterium A4]|jgi:DnaJ-class molecular chaperone|nr:hypothetical protein C804_05056 [Lachnospiraceae bacterium A4]
MKDYYKILGIEKQATEEQIKKAYRKLAKKYHPDVVKDDPAKQERMYEIQEAYECLGNEQRRRKYDSDCAGVPHKGAGVRPERDRKGNPAPSGPKMPDLSPFERFFGFTPGKGMETYRDQRAEKPQGPVPTDDLFAAFFGNMGQGGNRK